jgi:D-alanyl-D-alanine carboxypeptidase
MSIGANADESWVAMSSERPERTRRWCHGRTTRVPLRGSSLLLALLLCSFAGCESTDEGPSRSGAGSTATAAPSDLGGIDEAVARVEEFVDVYSYSSTGIAVRVRVGEQARTVVAGLASRVPRRRLRASDTFQIASVTKMMTATVVLQAVARGQLALDDTVDDWVPDLLDQGGEATLEQLLSHRSGLHDYVRWVKPGGELKTPGQAIAEVPAPDFVAGQDGAYSNTNFLVLGLVVEKATGSPFGELLRRDVLEPAGMTHTALFDVPGPGDTTTSGHVRGSADQLPSANFAGAAGGVVSNVGDLDRFLSALQGGDLLPMDLVESMTTSHGTLSDQGIEYGLAVMRRPTRCGTMLGHDGNIPGFRSELWSLADDQDRSVVVLENDDEGVGAQEIARQALCP